MATLTGKLISNTYKDLLQVSNGNDGVDSTVRFVSDGEGTNSALQISQSAVNIAGGFTVNGVSVAVETDVNRNISTGLRATINGVTVTDVSASATFFVAADQSFGLVSVSTGLHATSVNASHIVVVSASATDFTATHIIATSISATDLDLSGTLNYGGVLLTNAVTGTGKMVLDASPTLVTPVLGVATGTSFQGIIGNVAPAAITGTALTLTTGATVTTVLDEDNMASNSATALSTQQSIKAYVDAQVDTTDTLAEVLAIGNTTGGTDLGISAGDDITFTDSSKAIFGAGSDLKIFHEGGNSYIQDLGTGSLLIEGSSVQIRNSGGTETMASFTPDGAVSLYHNNAIKLATATTGVAITGEVTATGFTGTLDGILGSGTPAAATVTTLSATTVINITSAADPQVLKMNSQPTISRDNTTGELSILTNAAGAEIFFKPNNTLAATLFPGGNFTAVGGLAGTTGTFTGAISVDDVTDSTSVTTGSIHTDGGLGVAKALYVGTTSKLIGVTTHGGNVVSDTDSTDDLGTTGVRWANLFVDAITATDQITATGFTGTLDGILGSGTPAAATVTTLASGTHTVGTNSSGNSATLQTSNTFQFKLNGDTASQLGTVIWTNNSAATTANIWATGDSSSSGILRVKGIGNIDLVPGDIGIDGTAGYRFSTASLTAPNAAGPALLNEAATATNPTLIPNRADPDTGIGWVSANILTLITNGAEALRLDASQNATFVGAISVDDTTDSTSGTTGSIHTDGGLGVAKSVVVGTNLGLGGTSPTLHMLQFPTTGGDIAVGRYSTAGTVARIGLDGNSGSWASANGASYIAFNNNGVGNSGEIGFYTFDNAAGNFERLLITSKGIIEILAPGTAALPAVTLATDPDTGIWHPGANILAISNAGVETVRFDGSQNATFAGGVYGTDMIMQFAPTIPISGSATYYQNGALTSTDASLVNTRVPCPLTVKKMYVYVNGTLSSGSAVVTLMKDGAAQANTVAVDTSGGAFDSSPAISFTVGQRIGIKIVMSSASAAWYHVTLLCERDAD